MNPMTTTQHTPGPWKVEPAYTGTNRFPISHQIDSQSAGILAEVNGQGGTPEKNTANARLIAAAPEMLHALKCFIAYAEDGEATHDCDGNEFKDVKLARAAIAKATGKNRE